MNQTINGNDNRSAGGTYNENVFIQFEDSEYPIVSNLPKKVPYEHEFIGRQKEISEIISIVTGGKGGYKLSIEGIGGLGKTTLAYEVCRLMLDRNIAKYILWFTAKVEDFNEEIESFSGNFYDLKSFLKEAISLLGFKKNIEEYAVEDLKKIFKQLLGRQAKERIIFVLDNLETIKDSAFFNFIKEMQFIPGEFYLIITSRNNLFLYNENCTILSPLNDEEMQHIVLNFKKSFKLPKLTLDITTIINFCKGNPLIARILLQKMRYMSGEKIYKEYMLPSEGKGDEILDYIFKNTYDSLKESSRIFLLLLVHYEYIEDFLLQEIEKNIIKHIDGNFSIHGALENELRKTFFIKYDLSDLSIYGIENLRLEDFVENFLNSKQTDKSIELLAILNIEMEKLRQRLSRYENITKDFGARNKLDAMLIVQVFDKVNEVKSKRISPEDAINFIKNLNTFHANIPYIDLSLSKIYKNNYTDKLNDAISYGESALKKARQVLKGNNECLKHYLYWMIGLYSHGRLYNENYELNKELESFGLADYGVYSDLLRHESNIGQIEMALVSGKKGWELIKQDFDKLILQDKFKIESYIIGFYKVAVMLGDIDIMKEMIPLIKKYNLKIYDNPNIGKDFDVEIQFEQMEKFSNSNGIHRLKIRQLSKLYKTRLSKGFISEADYLDFLNQELEKDPQNGQIYYELHKFTNNPDFIFEAFKFDPKNITIIDKICRELIKFSGERIGDLLQYAEIGLSLAPESVNFYGYKGLYYLNKKQLDEAIDAFEKGVLNYNQLSISQQEYSQNIHHLKEINKHLSVAKRLKSDL